MARRPVDARGATAILMALLTCIVALPISALAVDIGQQRVVRTDMQTAADTVALDMARLLGAGTTPTNAAAQADFANTALGGTPVLKVWTGYVDPVSATWVSDQGLGCGSTHYNSYFQNPSTVGKPANAVLVGASGSAKFSLMPGSGGACRSAIAKTTTPSACFSVDSWAAQLKSGNSTVLNLVLGLLGGSVDTTLIGSSGIASTSVDVGTLLKILKVNLGVGTVDQVLTTNVTVAQLLSAEVQALTQSGTTASTVLNVLNTQFIAKLGNLVQNLPFQLGSILGLSQGAGSAVGASINALDLAMAGLNLANGQNALALNVATSPSIAGLSASVKVIQKPQTECGPVSPTTTLTSSQVTATATGNITGASLVGNLLTAVGGVVSLVTCVLGLLTGHCQSNLAVTVNPFSVSAALASATGTLTGISCSGGGANGLTLDESSSLAPITITLPITISLDDKNLWTGVTTHQSTTVTFTVSTVPSQPSPPATTGTFSLPTDYNQPKAGPSGNLSLNNLSLSAGVVTTDPYSLVGGLLGSLASLTNAVNGVLAGIEGSILTPLLSVVTTSLHTLLGLDLAGSSFTAVPTANCGAPLVVG